MEFQFAWCFAWILFDFTEFLYVTNFSVPVWTPGFPKAQIRFLSLKSQAKNEIMMKICVVF